MSADKSVADHWGITPAETESVRSAAAYGAAWQLLSLVGRLRPIPTAESLDAALVDARRLLAPTDLTPLLELAERYEAKPYGQQLLAVSELRAILDALDNS